jgi:hypothetical protein
LLCLQGQFFWGIPDGSDWRKAPSPGLRLIISLVEQLSGTIEPEMSIRRHPSNHFGMKMH